MFVAIGNNPIPAAPPPEPEVLAVTGQDLEARTAVLPQAKSLSMKTGIFALLWATVTVLMIIRPGSTTGV